MPDEIIISAVTDEIIPDPETYPENFNFSILSKWLNEKYVKNITLNFDASSAEVIGDTFCF